MIRFIRMHDHENGDYTREHRQRLEKGPDKYLADVLSFGRKRKRK